MKSVRIAELLAPFLKSANDQRLTTRDFQYISTYIDLLLRWNTRINLTAIRDPEEIVTRHFGESFFAARHLFPTTTHVATAALGCPAERSSAVRLADLGSGAGFPGIPIKLWAPHAALTLIESNHKKVAFLREVIRTLTLTGVNILHARAEDLLEDHARIAVRGRTTPHVFDFVTLRAVECFGDVLSTAARLLVPGGRLALLIGSSQLDLAHSILPTFAWKHPLPIPLSQSRILLIGIQPDTLSAQPDQSGNQVGAMSSDR
jgi:16S rRNA (guanine527-N7)-methyltransferase